MWSITAFLLAIANVQPTHGSPAEQRSPQQNARPVLGASCAASGTWVARVELPLRSPLEPSMVVLHLRFVADASVDGNVAATLCGIDFPVRYVTGEGNGGPPPVRFEVQEGYFDDATRLAHTSPARWRASAQGAVFDIGPLVLSEGAGSSTHDAWPRPSEGCFQARDGQDGIAGLPLQPRTDAGYAQPFLGMIGASKVSRQTVAARIEMSLHATATSADSAEGYADVTYTGDTGPLAFCVKGCELVSSAGVSGQPCSRSQVAYANVWADRWEWRLGERAKVNMWRLQDLPACVVVRNWDHI